MDKREILRVYIDHTLDEHSYFASPMSNKYRTSLYESFRKAVLSHDTPESLGDNLVNKYRVVTNKNVVQ